MCKSRLSDKWSSHVRLQVGTLIDILRQTSKLIEPLFLFASQLQHQIGQYTDEIGVPTPFTISVDGALNMACTGLDGRKAVGHCKLTVVVRMNADGQREAAHGLLDPFSDLFW